MSDLINTLIAVGGRIEQSLKYIDQGKYVTAKESLKIALEISNKMIEKMREPIPAREEDVWNE